MSEFVGVPRDREAEDKPAPRLPRYLQVVYDSWATLGTDDKGKPTWVEQRQFLDEHRVRDVDERRIWQFLWSAVTAAVANERTRAWEDGRES